MGSLPDVPPETAPYWRIEKVVKKTIPDRSASPASPESGRNPASSPPPHPRFLDLLDTAFPPPLRWMEIPPRSFGENLRETGNVFAGNIRFADIIGTIAANR